MDRADTALEMAIGWKVLIVPARSAVVCEAQSFPFPEVHVQESLIGTVKADASLCQREQGVVVAHIWVQHHHSTVEAVRPADVWDCCKVCVQSEKLVGSSQAHRIGIDVDNALVLCLPP